MEQGSEEWHEFRRNHIGASDASVITLVSPWKTPYQLYLEKQCVDVSSPNHQQRRGLELEQAARDWFEKKTGIFTRPQVLVHPKIEWMSASLDGIDFNGECCIEIKCPGQKDHQIALNQKIPEKYIPQLQHQMEVTGLDHCFYVSFDGIDGVIVEVSKDKLYVELLISKEQKFWDCLQNKIPPDLSEKDYRKRNDLEWENLAKRFQEVRSECSRLEEEEQSIRMRLIELCGNQSSEGFGVKVLKGIRKGTIDYDRIPCLKEMDLEKFRKSPSVYWKLS